MRWLSILFPLLLVACVNDAPIAQDFDGGSHIDAGSHDAGSRDAGFVCPSDPSTLEGTSCAPEGARCGECSGDPCSFCNFVLCVSGVWQHQEVFPLPCTDGGTDGGTCVARTEDASAIARDCDPLAADSCPPMYACEPMNGGVLAHICQIRCSSDCDCPGDGTCEELCDKAGCGRFFCTPPNDLGDGDLCDPGADRCGAGFTCCYPCGIPGCDHECMPTCTDPQCVNGCMLFP